MTLMRCYDDHLTPTSRKQERISMTTKKYRKFRREVNGSTGTLVGNRESLVNKGAFNILDIILSEPKTSRIESYYFIEIVGWAIENRWRRRGRIPDHRY